MQLVRRDALLGRAKQVRRLKHLMERDAGVLKDSADLDGELLAAVAALVKAIADALVGVRLDLADAAHAAAVRADRAVRPNHVLKESEGRFLIVEPGLRQNRH